MVINEEFKKEYFSELEDKRLKAAIENGNEILACGCIEECMCEGDPNDFCDN